MRVFAFAPSRLMKPRRCAAGGAFAQGGAVRRRLGDRGGLPMQHGAEVSRTKRAGMGRLLGGAMALLLAHAPAHAAEVVSNISLNGNGSYAYAGTLGGAAHTFWNDFTTGSKHAVLNSIKIKVSSKTGNPPNLTVWLYSAGGQNAIQQLSGPSSPGAGDHTYTCSSTTGKCNLAANTTYGVYLHGGITGLNNRYNFELRNSPNETGSGWSIADKAGSNRGEKNGPLGFAVDATETDGALTVPKKIKDLQVDPGNRRLVVSWDRLVPPSKLLLDYDVQYKAVSASNWTNWWVHTESSTTITGLTNGTVYQVQVRAENSLGEGPWSDAVSAESGAPSIPKHLLASAGNAKLAISWQASNGNGSSVTGYDVQYRAGNSGDWSNHTHTGTGTSATITPLTNNTKYQVQVRGKNSQGNSPWALVGGRPTTAASPTSSDFTKTINPSGKQDVKTSQFPYLDSGGSGLGWVEIVTLPNASDGKLVETTGRRRGNRWTYSDADVTVGQRVVNDAWVGSRTRKALRFIPAGGFTSASFTFKVVNRASVVSSATYTATLVSKPAKPAGVTATAGNTQVRLSWTNPNDAAIQRWQYQYKTTGAYGSWANFIGSSASTTSRAVTGLTNGTAHTFKIRAVSAGGNGPASDEVSATPAAATPATPTGLKAAVGNRSITLTWNDPDDASITKYRIRKKTTGGTYESWADISSSHAATISHTVSGLTNDTSYTFQIQAQNATGNTASIEVSATPNVVPSAPTGLAAAALGDGVQLTWTNPSNSAISKYQYEQKWEGNFKGGWTEIASSSATTTSYRVTGLTNGTTYYFRIRAVNSAGASGASAEASATPPGPPLKPTGLSAEPTGGDNVKLTWDDPSDASITKYQMRRKISGQNPYSSWIVIAHSATTTTVTVDGIVDRSVTYQIRAVNSKGAGASSDEVSAKIVIVQGVGKPTGLTAASLPGEVVLQWYKVTQGNVTKYQYQQKTSGEWGADWTDMTDSSGATTSHTVRNLTDGTAYTFRIRAVGGPGEGPASNEVTATPGAGPAKPTGLTAKGVLRDVTLKWDAANDASITGWQYQNNRDGGAWSGWADMSSAGAATTSYTITNLPADSGRYTIYAFRIRAVNQVGNSLASDTATATTVVLAAPQGVTATGKNRSVDLAWNNPNDSTIVAYEYRRKEDRGQWTSWTSIPGSNASTTSYTVGSLTNGTSYTFQVRAAKRGGFWRHYSPGSAQVTATPSGTAPAAPTGLSAVPRDASAVLSWSNAGDKSITAFQYRSKTGGGWTNVAWTDIPDSGAATTSYTVPNLVNGTSYAFQIRARNGVGDSPASGEAAASPRAAPAKPANLSAATTSTSMTLTWSNPNDSTITAYQYRRKEGSAAYGSWMDMASSGATTTSYTAASLTSGTRYAFRIRAINQFGTGTESDEVGGIPAPAPAAPTGLGAEAGNTRVVLSWNDPGNASIVRYEYRQRENQGSWENWTEIGNSGATTTGYTVTSLTNGTPYDFQLRAVNLTGSSSASGSVSATPYPVPDRPTGLAKTLTAATGTAYNLALTWTNPNDATITKWQYQTNIGSGYVGRSWTEVGSSSASTTSLSLSGQARDSLEGIRIRAANTQGAGLASAEMPLPPAKPAKLRAEAGDGRVFLRWQDPSDATITQRQYRSKTSGDWTRVAWIDMTSARCGGAVTTVCTVGNLTNGTEYSFQVRALNLAGDGAAADEVTATPADELEKPTGLAASGRHERVELTWDDPRDSAITVYQYRVKLDEGAYGLWRNISGSGATTTNFTLGGLENGTVYTFQIRAVTKTTLGPASDEATTTATARPGKPGGLSAAARDRSAVLSWTNPNDSTITSYQYQKRTGSKWGETWTDMSNSGASTTTYTATGLENGTRYSFRIRALNVGDPSDVSDRAEATPQAVPAAPANVQATAGDTQVVLRWDLLNDNTVSKFQTRHKETSGNYGDWADVSGSDWRTVSATVSGLTNDTAYTFQVRAVSSYGDGAASAEVSATPVGAAAVPAKPTGLTAHTENRAVTLRWTDPNDATITKYEYQQKTTGSYGTWTEVLNSGATTTSYRVGGLDNGTAYTFRIRAKNTSGNSSASDEASATPTAVPLKPTGLAAEVGNRQLLLTWVDPQHVSITKYHYRSKVKTSNTYGSWQDIAGSDWTTTSHTVTGLQNNTEYTVQIRASNLQGNGPAAEVSATPAAVPLKPTGFKAFGGISAAVLSWDDPSDSTITGYQYRQKSGGTYGSWMAIPSSGASTTNYRVPNLTNNTTYAFRIRALNATGNGTMSDEVSATPRSTVPSKPTGLTAEAGNSKAYLRWNNPGDGAITKYEYRRETAGSWGNWAGVPNSDATTTAYTATGLTNATTYKFQIRAVSEAGNSAASDEATVTPSAVPDRPIGLTATGGTRQAALSWSNPNDSAITKYEYQWKTTGSYGAWVGISNSSATTTNHTVANLSSITTYAFRIRAVNSTGASAPSDPASVRTASTPPAKPTGLTASSQKTQIRLSWTALKDYSITEYEYRQKEGVGNYGDWTNIPSSGGDTSYYTFKNLKIGTAYTFKLRAVNTVGAGAESDELATGTLAPPPAKPTGVAAQARDGGALLTWTDPNNAAIGKWQYWIERNAIPAGGWRDIQNSTASTTSYRVPNLANGTAYDFRVRATTAGGAGARSDKVSATPQPAPSQPTGLSAAASGTQAALTWANPNDSAITAYQYRKKEGANTTYGDWTDISSSGSSTTSHTVTGLNNGVGNAFHIRALNAYDPSGYSNEATVPAKPAGLSAAVGDTRSMLTWNSPSAPSHVSKYQYQQKTSGDWTGVEWTDMGGSGTTSHTVESLTNDTAYTFRIRAISATGQGVASSEATVTPISVPAKPSGLTASAASATSATLSWTDPSDASITAYQYRSKEGTNDYGDWTDISSSGASTTNHTVSSLTAGVKYAFEILARNAAGPSTKSNSATMPAKPAGLSAAVGDARSVLTWNSPSTPSYVSKYQYRQKEGQGNYGNWSSIATSTATTTSHTVESLTNDTAYTFQIRAISATGEGVASDEATVTPIAVPAKPTGLSASLATVPGQSDKYSLMLTWTNPNDSTITQWQYQTRAGTNYGNDWTEVSDSTASTTTVTLPPQDRNALKGIRIQAVNTAGASPASEEVGLKPPQLADFAIVAGNQSADLSWTSPSYSLISKYQYQQKTGNTWGSWTDMPSALCGGVVTISCTVGSLTNNTSYAFRIRAWNLAADGVASAEASVTPVPVPSKPTGLSASLAAVSGQNDKYSLTLTWANPSNSTITQWQYQTRTGSNYTGRSWTEVENSSASTTTVTLSEKDRNDWKGIRIRAVNSGGDSPPSAEALLVPVQPTGLSASASDGEAVLRWTDPGHALISKYQYRQKEGQGNYGNWTDMTSSVCGGAVTTSCTVGSLTNDTAYTFRIRAVSVAGESAASGEASATPITVPAKPASFAASAASTTSVTLSWTDPSDTSITKYEYRQKKGTGHYSGWTDIPDSADGEANAAGYTVPSLSAATEYAFKIRAWNTTGAGPESDVVTVATKPSKPTGLAATGGNRQVALSWTAPSGNKITQYQYRQKEGTGNYGSWTNIPDSAHGDDNATGYTVPNLSRNTLYAFKIKALNASGESAESDEASARTLAVPAKPTGLSASGSDGAIVLSWTDPNDSTITKYQYRQKEGANNYGGWTDISDSADGQANDAGYTVTGLEASTTYTFKIRAWNALGESVESNEATAQTLPVPVKPTGLSKMLTTPYGTLGKFNMTLSWSNPNNATIDKYQYQLKDGSGDWDDDWTDIANSGASTVSWPLGTRTKNTLQAVRIRAVNGSGNGAQSDDFPVLPVKPAGLVAAGAGSQRVELRWNNPNDNTIDGYQYRKKVGTGDWETDWTNMAGSGASTVSYTVDGLLDETPHKFRIRAVNEAGEGAESDEASATPAPVPAAPANLQATLSAATGTLYNLTLTWTALTDPTISRWEYQTKPVGGNYGSNWTGIGSSGASTTTHTLSSQSRNTTEAIRLRAVNQTGNGAQTEVQLIPDRPTNLAAVARNQSADLSWTDPNYSLISKYRYRHKTGTNDYGDWTDIPDSAPGEANATSYTVPSLTNGSEYTLQIQAWNLAGESSASAGATATPVPVPSKPTGLSVSLAASGGSNYVATLTWTKPSGLTVGQWQYQTRTGTNYGNDWTEMSPSTASTTTWTLPAQARNTWKGIRIRVVNTAGDSPASEEVDLVPPQSAGLAAVAKHQSVDLSWTAPQFSLIAGHQYQQRTGNAWGNTWTDIPSSAPGETNATSYTAPSLTNGTTYTFRVRAANPAFDGAASSSVSATPAPVPAKPAGLSASLARKGSDYNLTLTWTNPNDSSITQWQYRTRTGDDYSGNWMGISSSTASTTTWARSRLPKNQWKGIRIRAVNSTGVGAESDEILLIPKKPADLTATAGVRKVVLEWTDPDHALISKYQYQRKTSGNWTNAIWRNMGSSGASTTRYTMSGLVNSTTYAFRIRAVSLAGNGAISDEVSATPAPVPAQPTGLSRTLTAVTGQSGKFNMTLNWSDPNNATIGKYQYQLKKKQTDGSFKYGGWEEISNSGASTASLSLPSQTQNELQAIRIRAVNKVGENGPASAELPLVPAKPGLTAAPKSGQIALSWSNPNDSTIAGYQYRQKTTGAYGGWTAIPNSAPGQEHATGYTVGSLTNRTAYTFQIRALNLAGNGLVSDEVSETPSEVPAKPTGLAASLASGSDYDLTLTWTNPNDALVTGYEYQTRTSGNDYGTAWTEMNGSTASTTSHLLRNVSKNAFQEVRIRAANKVGASTPSEGVLAVPAKPTGLAATARATGTDSMFLDLVWNDANDDTIASWQYRLKARAEDEYVSLWQDVPSSDKDTTTHAVSVSSFQASYVIKIRAANLAGDGLDSTEASGSLLPSAPTNLTATVSGSSVVLAWSNADAKRPAITGYKYRFKKGDGSYGQWEDIPQSDASTTTYTVASGVGEKGTTYAFQVRGMSNAGDGAASNEASALTVPAAPQGFHAALGNRSAVLTWADPNDSTITGYEYRRKIRQEYVDYGSWLPIPQSNHETTSYTVPGLVNGTEYLIQIRAKNAAGPGGPAGAAFITPGIVPSLVLALDPASAAENAGATAVTVTAQIVNGPLSTTTTVTLAGQNRTAEADDYMLPQTMPTISIAGGQATGTATLTVTPIDDLKDEADETFILNAEALSSVLGARKLTASETFTITDDDEPPTLVLSLSSEEAAENAATAATVTVTATLVGATREAATTVTVTADDAASTATRDADYSIAYPNAGTSATIEIVGDDPDRMIGTATVTITPIDDEFSEAHETVVLKGTAIGLEDGSTEFTIRDDENPALSLSLSLARIRENEEPKVVTVTAETNRIVEDATAEVSLTPGGTATFGEDYKVDPAQIPTILIPIGQSSGTATVTVAPVADDVLEGEETIEITAAATRLEPGTTTAIIWEYSLEEEKAILSEVLTEIMHGTLASARHVLSGRFRSTANGNGARVAGFSAELFESSDAPPAQRPPGMAGFGEEEAARISSQAWWKDSAFEYRSRMGRRWDAVHWSLWGQGDYVDFSGEIRGSGSYDGDVRSAYLGMDARVVGEWVAGLAIGHSRGRADYELEEEAGGISGLLKTKLTSVYPYLSAEWDDGFEAWAMLGAGEGDIELERLGASEKIETADLSMLMGAFGIRSELASGGINGPTYSLVADAAYAEFETDQGAPVVDNLIVDMYQVRLGLEYACSAAMGGGRGESYMQAFARYDGGDGIEGAGLELVGGLRFANATGWEVDAQGRWLAAHAEDEYEEYGVSLALKKEWGRDRRGLYLLLLPQWGASPESSAAVWGGSAFELQDIMEQSNAFALKAELGYGSYLPLIGRPVAWFSEFECGDGGDRWRMRAGARFEAWRASNFKVEVFGAYEDMDGKPERSINVHSTLGY